MSKTKTYYICDGSVRGECGHHHRTLSGAERCLVRDQDGCANQGGYSDRSIVEITGSTRTQIEAEEI